MAPVVRQRTEGVDRSLQGRRAGWRARRLVHQRQNIRDRNVQERQARGRVEAMGPPRLQELGGNLQGRQENLMTARVLNAPSESEIQSVLPTASASGFSAFI